MTEVNSFRVYITSEISSVLTVDARTPEEATAIAEDLFDEGDMGEIIDSDIVDIYAEDALIES